MSTNLDEARKTLRNVNIQYWGFSATDFTEAIEAIARAVFHDETEKAEAERRQRLDDFKRRIGAPVYDEAGGGPEDEPATSSTDTGAGEGLVARVMERAQAAVRYGIPIQSDADDVLAAMQAQAATIADLERRLAEANSALATANSTVAGLANKVGEARRERDAALASLAEMKAMIADSVAVHVNMLRGAIAKPSVENIRHLYPEIAASLAEKERRIGELERALAEADGLVSGYIASIDKYEEEDFEAYNRSINRHLARVLDRPPLSTTGRGSDE